MHAIHSYWAWLWEGACPVPSKNRTQVKFSQQTKTKLTKARTTSTTAGHISFGSLRCNRIIADNKRKHRHEVEGTFVKRLN